ncbi:MAG: 50S ribosomal protein L24 [Anaerolineales bacterium]|nr:50S ribosomal protein L24 [Anaerolineales bacterium]
MKVRIRKGDTVKAIAGKDKGKSGEVIKVLPKDNRVVVQGVNLKKKHQSQVQAKGRNIDTGIIEFEGPFDMSNVMLVCPKCKKPVRVGVRREDDGKAVRVCRKCKKDID